MKIFEVEGSINDVAAAASDYLMSLKAQGVEEIPTGDLLEYLQGIGMSVDSRSLIDIMDQIPFATNANEETISLVPTLSNDVIEPEQEISNKDRVKQMAQQSSDIM